MNEKKKLSIGLIGSGFMGKAHVFGFATAQKVFDLPMQIDLHTVADIDDKIASRAAHEFGFRNATSNWKTMIANPEIDIIDITAPNALHKEMALAAIAAGKHVYCEKPLDCRWQTCLLRKATCRNGQRRQRNGRRRRSIRRKNASRLQLYLQSNAWTSS